MSDENKDEIVEETETQITTSESGEDKSQNVTETTENNVETESEILNEETTTSEQNDEVNTDENTETENIVAGTEESLESEITKDKSEETTEEVVETIEKPLEKKSKKKNKKSSKKSTEKIESEVVEAEEIKVENTEEKVITSIVEKKEKKGFGVKFGEVYNKIQSNILLLLIVCIVAFLVMGLTATAIFLSNVKGPEQVLVPNVVGKKLEDALLDMQVKELYPKINLRYSQTPGDEGTILEQSPESGAIVKGYSRVNLVVSRGVVVDKVGNYIGMNIDDLRMNLQTLFAGQTRPLIVLAEPKYKPDASEAGTILEQNPPEGTNISQPVTVQLIVSRGPNYDNTKAPNLMGQSVNDVLQTIARSKIIFDFTSHIALDGEKAGTVVAQDSFNSEYIPNYSHVNVEFALPEGAVNDNIYGLFTAELSEYPYPVPMRLDAVPVEGNSYTVLSFSHSGGKVTIPYAVPAETKLVLYVVDKAVASVIVN